MNIQIVRKKAPVKSVTLLFKKQTLRSQYSKIPIVSIYDEESKYVSVSVSLNRVPSRVPATLLARWVNVNYPDKLLTLIDRCNTVGYSYDRKHSQNGKWYFRSKENTIFGLHKLKKRVDSVTTRSVVIDDSLNMQDVKNILNMLDIEIECDYDVNKQRMLKITLKGDVYMKDLDYVYDKFENLILFLEAEVNGTYECDEVLEAKEALNALYQIIGGEVASGKLYRVIDNTDMEYYNVKVGDLCTLVDTDGHGAWFHNDRWRHDGDWCLSWNMVEEVK